MRYLSYGPRSPLHSAISAIGLSIPCESIKREARLSTPGPKKQIPQGEYLNVPWRRIGWASAVTLAASEYSWLATIGKWVPSLPEGMWPIQALLFPATVLAMAGSVAFMASLIRAVAERRSVGVLDWFVALSCAVLTGIVLHW
jgi:hypothetical protein